MYKPDKLIDIAMEQLYSQNYCLVDKALTTLITDIKETIATHEYYSRYELVETDDGMYKRLELIGKEIYSF